MLRHSREYVGEWVADVSSGFHLSLFFFMRLA